MSNDEQAIEQAIKDAGKTAPRITPSVVDAAISDESFHVFDGTTLTVCVLTLRNGFTVTGESAAASPENFDRSIGERIARDNARQKIWPLLGYALREQMHRDQGPWEDRIRREQTELRTLTQRLESLLSKPRPEHVSMVQWGLMQQQLAHMNGYLAVLGERLRNL